MCRKEFNKYSGKRITMSTNEVESLISSGNIRSASRKLSDMVSDNPDNDHLWYLKGMTSLKARNYEGALDSFTKAHMLRKKPEYFRMKGIANMQVFNLDDAIENFEEALEHGKDVQSLFFLSVCYMFFDNSLAMDFLKKAYLEDRKKTKQLLNNFYSTFFAGKSLDAATKRKIRETLADI
jgi:tetratricopeptide (TPR) repeat protein